MIAGVRLPHPLFMHYIYKHDIYHFQEDYYFTFKPWQPSEIIFEHVLAMIAQWFKRWPTDLGVPRLKSS